MALTIKKVTRKRLVTDLQSVDVLEIKFNEPTPTTTNEYFDLYTDQVFVQGCSTFSVVENKTFVCPMTNNGRTYFTGSSRSANIYRRDYTLDFYSNGLIQSSTQFYGVMYPIFYTFSDGNHLFNIRSVDNNTLRDVLTHVPATNSKFGYIVTNGESKLTTGIVYKKDENAIIESNYLYTLAKDISTDPYDAGGTSTGHGVGGGGGTGDFDNTSDTITLPPIPTLSGLNTGFFTAFIPSASQMQSISNYLWNNFLEDIIDPESTISEKVDALKKIIANPYDAIMGCSVIPVTPPTAGSKELKMYGLIKTGISIPYASTRWVTVDCGTLNIHEFWGGYLDYSPYTKTTSLYLPYIGTVSIDIDLIMAKALQVVYRVDILSGICVAFILVDGSVKFHYQGQCATQIPITNADYSSVISAGIGLIGSASQVVGSAVAGASTGGPVGAVVGAVGSAVSQAPSVASNVMGAKPDIRSGGSVGSSAGILSVQRPYLIIERPRQSLPEYQNTFTGYPSNVTASVGELAGYTEFESINLDNLFLTDAEKEELTNILKGGVYL